MPGSRYLAKERWGDRMSAQRKGGSVFSHRALSLSIQRGLPGSWKNTYNSPLYTQKHIVGVDVQKDTLMLHVTAMVQT